jgi:outer membrane biosynthesis protein TonB
MRSLAWAMLAAAVLLVSACGSPEQPPAKSAPPAVATPAPLPPAPAVPVAPPATVVVPPPAPQPAPAPAAPPPPAEPVKPAAPVADAPKAPAAAPVPAATQPAAPTAKIPDSVTLAASQGQVTLPHLAHAKSFPCATCHGDGTPGKIGLNKDAAHNLCRDCHNAKGAGPTTCTGCHKK